MECTELQAPLAVGQAELAPHAPADEPPPQGGHSNDVHHTAFEPFSLQDLERSWLFFFLRVFHAWSFLLATVTIAGNGINTFLNMFVEFSAYLSEKGHELQSEDFSKFAQLLCRSVLLVLAFSGLVQRGWWLLLDSLEHDMFINYRRTLCLEGPGPGDFMSARRRIRLELQEDRRLLHRAMTQKQDVVINGIGLPKDSALLLQQASASASTRVATADDVLSIGLPAELDFKVPGRPAGIFQVGGYDKARAVADIILQALIFLSLDLIPLVWSMLTLRNLFDILSLSWLNFFVTKAVLVCNFHVLIYFLVSTCVDYAWKVDSLRRMACHEPEPVLLVNQATLLRGSRSGGNFVQSSSDMLNLCVLLRNCLATRPCQWVLLVSSFFGLVATVVLMLRRQSDIAFSLGVCTVSAFWLFVYFRCRFSSRELARGFEDLGRTWRVAEETFNEQWARWFRAHCGVSPLGVFMQELGLFIVSVLFIVSFFFNVRLGVVLVVAAVLFCWSLMLMFFAMFSADQLWVFILAERLIFGAVSLAVAASARLKVTGQDDDSMTSGVLSALALIGLTQLGMWRQGNGHSHSLSVCFFVTIVVAIAVLSFMAGSSTGGGALSNKHDDWCPKSGSPTCQEFQFPLHGYANSSYEFCGLSWPMGAGDTVSGQCEDTRLTIVDFGQISTIAGLAPNHERVLAAMAKFLPNWTLQHIQTYNRSLGTETTFVHLIRGSTTVIAVRGTSSAVEVLQDLNLWMRIGFLQLARKVGPSCYSARAILRAFTANRTELMGDSFKDLVTYVKTVVSKHRDTSKIYITGHSLGGGLATVVGAIFGIPAVTFSAPGLEATSAILRPSPKEASLLRYGVNVVPRGDLVPMVDEQTGTVLHIACHHPSALQCHLLRNTMCELLSACGDGGGRRFPRGYTRAVSACGAERPPEVSV